MYEYDDMILLFHTEYRIQQYVSLQHVVFDRLLVYNTGTVHTTSRKDNQAMS